MKPPKPWLHRIGIGAAVILLIAAGIVGSTLGTRSTAPGRLGLAAPNGQVAPGADGADPAAGDLLTIATSIKNDLSRPLASIAPREYHAPEEPEGVVKPRKWLPGREALSGALSALGGMDPVLQTAPLGEAMPAPLVSFEGVNNVNGVLPPDTNGDIGPDHYVQWVNLSFAIYDRTGTRLYGPAAGNTLWDGFGGLCESTNSGDPIALYDHLADRWFMSQFAFGYNTFGYPKPPFYQCIAVSQTGDPLGAWYRYAFLYSNTKLNDYPKFGVWPDAYYMAANQFLSPSFTWAGQGVVAFERDQMLLGQAARMVYFDLYGVDPNMGGMLPSDLDGPPPATGTPNYFIEIDDDAWGYSPDQLQMWQFHVDWANTANSTFTPTVNLPTAAFSTDMCGYSRTCIPQPGTSAKLDALADRLMYRLQYRNFGAYQVLVSNHTVDVDGTDRAGLRWFELRNSGAGWSIYQQSTFSPDSTDRWMASLAMDALGNMALGYSISSGSIYPSIRYTGRLASDPLNTMPQGEATLINGSGSQTHSAARWGDYSMMAVDPADGCTFWYTQEYIQTTGSAPWQTRVGSFAFPGCGGDTGALGGTVTNAATGTPISGATVTAGSHTTSTDAWGNYHFTGLPVGNYDVAASAGGYTTQTALGVAVTAGGTTDQDFALSPATCGSRCLRSTITLGISGSRVVGQVLVRLETGQKVRGADIAVLWTLPGGSTTAQTAKTNNKGQARFVVSGGAGTYTLTITNITRTGGTFDPANSELSQSIAK